MGLLSNFIADGGFKSRKLLFGIGCVVVLSVMILAAVHYSTIVGLYSTFVGGVVSIYGIYAGVNVASRHSTASKLGTKLADKAADADENPPPPAS